MQWEYQISIIPGTQGLLLQVFLSPENIPVLTVQAALYLPQEIEQISGGTENPLLQTVQHLLCCTFIKAESWGTCKSKAQETFLYQGLRFFPLSW